MQTPDLVYGLLQSLATTSLVGFLFWQYLKTLLESKDRRIDDLETDMKEIRHDIKNLLAKEDFFKFEERIEKQLEIMQSDIKEIPENISQMLRDILKNNK